MVQQTLIKAMQPSHDFVSSIACRMSSKFQKYWSEYSTIIVIAIILDPWCKVQFVDFCLNKLYGP